MRAVGIKVLKNRLSEYIRIVTHGETVLVTDRERVVAEIIPPRPGISPLVSDSILADAVKHGWLTPPTLVPDTLPPRLPVMRFGDLLQEIGVDRADR